MQKNEMAWAHTKAGASPSEWHLLSDHLESVGTLASGFAAKFRAGPMGRYAGLWHDLGKFAADWQKFLVEAGENAPVLGDDSPHGGRFPRRRGPDHSSAGAIHARRTIKPRAVAKILEFAIAAHHAGLADDLDLDDRLRDDEKQQRYLMALEAAEAHIVASPERLELPLFLSSGNDSHQQARRFEFFVRMLFSTLVDADFLDTERFMEIDGARSSHRAGWLELASYLEPLDRRIESIRNRSKASSHVSASRDAVLRWCTDAARGERGVYTLTVPTGGGKTLSSLAFALRHARHHDLERVIIALPFLTIVDQTAQVLRDTYEPLFGDRVLVEHHSNIIPERDTMRNRVAAENWDAPLIVTTQVQLFESLFARRPSDCRKLHNLANSVVILDEVQTLPVGLLEPILEVLQELVSNYGTSLLLTTATQPALHTRSLGAARFRGLSPEPQEIVPGDALEDLFHRFRRVDVHWPESGTNENWLDLAGRMAAERQVLGIVHRRADAAELWRQLDAIAPGALHLSALMCPAHRREVLTTIRDLLERGDECRVVSTQLVEAGVDVDFPVVFRAMAGLESLAQSAGRCNRDGRLERGQFHVFQPPTEPVGSLRHHKEIAEVMLKSDPALDLMAPATFRRYFDKLYAERARDSRNVQVARQSLQFETTAERFRMIDDATTTIFVPFGDPGAGAIESFRYAGPSRQRFRDLQSFGVAVYPNALRDLAARGAVELLQDTVHVLTSPRDYDRQLGLLVDRQPFESLIV